MPDAEVVHMFQSCLVCPLADEKTIWQEVRDHRVMHDTTLTRAWHLQVMKLRWISLLLVVAQAPASSQQSMRRDAPARRITFGVYDPRPLAADSHGVSALRGITLGIEEARLTAQLFGWEVLAVKHPDNLSPEEGVQFLTRAGVTAIVGNLTGPLQRSPATGGPLLIDVGPRRRRVGCDHRTFHVLPMLDSAVMLKNKEARPANHTDVIAWDSSLQRFGAAQLNERYRRRFGVAMDEHAWAGWMSTKLVLDAAMKIKSSEPCALQRFLVTDAARFDGHKGVSLFFDPQTHELVQPLYVRRKVGEAETVDVSLRTGAHNLASTAGKNCHSTCA